MKKVLSVVFVCGLVGLFFLSGCAKKQETVSTENQDPMSMETLSTLEPATPAVSTEVVSDTTVSTVQGEALTESPIPVSSAKPSSEEIQTALKNAGYYSGVIDGKVGPNTKKAIEDFQKASSLKIDGKVGPMTWAALSKFLNAVPAVITEKVKVPSKR